MKIPSFLIDSYDNDQNSLLFHQFRETLNLIFTHRRVQI